MMNFNELAKQCKKNKNTMEGIVHFMSKVFTLETYFMPGKLYSTEGGSEEILPFTGDLENGLCVFIFTDIDKCCNFAIENKITGKNGKVNVLQFDMKEFNENIMHFIESGIKSTFVNYGEDGLQIDLTYIIELYTKMFLNKNMVKFGVRENTEVFLKVPENIKQIKEQLEKEEENYISVESLYVVDMTLNSNSETESICIAVDFENKNLEDYEKEEIFDAIGDFIERKNIICQSKFSFIDSSDIIPQELKNQVRIW